MKTKIFYTLALILSIGWLAACQSDSDELADAVVQFEGYPSVSVDSLPLLKIHIHPDKSYQTMDGIGACSYAFPYANVAGWNWNQTKFVFDSLDIQYIRLASWFDWEMTNDNNDPKKMAKLDAFKTPESATSNHDVPFAKFLTERDIEVSLGIWAPADWIAPKVEGKKYRRIDPDMYAEFGETISAYVKNMEANGVPLPYVQVQNEPSWGVQVLFGDRQTPEAPEGPTDLANCAAVLAEQLSLFGFEEVKLYGPDNHQPNHAAFWSDVWLQNPTVKARTAGISYHTWWSDDFEHYDAIRKVGEEHEVPVWATEVGYCALVDGCFNNSHFLKPETWETAWDYAMSHYRAIAWSHASRTYQWSLLGHNGCVGKKGEIFPSFYILKHFANFIPPESVFLDSKPPADNVYCMPFQLEDGQYSAVIINDSPQYKKLQISLSEGEALHIQEVMGTTQHAYGKTLKTYTSEGQTSTITVLPPESIVSVRMSK